MNESTIQALRRRVEELKNQTDEEKFQAAQEVSAELLDLREAAEQKVAELKKTFDARKRSIEKKLAELGTHKRTAEDVLAFKKRFHALEREWMLCLTEYDHVLSHNKESKKIEETKKEMEKQRASIRDDYKKREPNTASVEPREPSADAPDSDSLAEPDVPENNPDIVGDRGETTGDEIDLESRKNRLKQLNLLGSPQLEDEVFSRKRSDGSFQYFIIFDAGHLGVTIQYVDDSGKALDDKFEEKMKKEVWNAGYGSWLNKYHPIERSQSVDDLSDPPDPLDTDRDNKRDTDSGDAPEEPAEERGPVPKGSVRFGDRDYKIDSIWLYGDLDGELKPVVIKKRIDKDTLRVELDGTPIDISKTEWEGKNFPGFPKTFAGRSDFHERQNIVFTAADGGVTKWKVVKTSPDATLHLQDEAGQTKVYTEDEFVAAMSPFQKDTNIQILYEKAPSIKEIKQEKMNIFEIEGAFPKEKDVVVLSTGNSEIRLEFESFETLNEQDLEQLEVAMVGIIERTAADGTVSYTHERIRGESLQTLLDAGYQMSIEKHTAFEVRNLKELFDAFDPGVVAQAYTDFAFGRTQGREKLLRIFDTLPFPEHPTRTADIEKRDNINAFLKKTYGVESIQEFITIWKSDEMFPVMTDLLEQMAAESVQRMTNQDAELRAYDTEQAKKEAGPKEGFFKKSAHWVSRAVKQAFPGASGAVVAGTVAALSGGTALVVGGAAGVAGAALNRIYKEKKMKGGSADRRGYVEGKARDKAKANFAKEDGEQKYGMDRLQAIANTILKKRKSNRNHMPQFDRSELYVDALTHLQKSERKNSERARTYQLEKLSHLIAGKNAQYRDEASEALSKIDSNGFLGTLRSVVAKTLRPVGEVVTGNLWLNNKNDIKRYSGLVATSVVGGLVGMSILGSTGILAKATTRFGIGFTRGAFGEGLTYKEKHQKELQQRLVRLEQVLASKTLKTGPKNHHYESETATINKEIERKLGVPIGRILFQGVKTGGIMAVAGRVAEELREVYDNYGVPDHGYDPNGAFAPKSMKGDFATPEPDNPKGEGVGPETKFPEVIGEQSSVVDTEPGLSIAPEEDELQLFSGGSAGSVFESSAELAQSTEPLGGSDRAVETSDLYSEEPPLTLRSEAEKYVDFHNTHGIEQVQPNTQQGSTSIAAHGLSESPVFGGSAKEPSQVFVKGKPGEHAQVFVKNAHGEVFQFSGEHLREILRDLPEPDAAAEVEVPEPAAAASVEAAPDPELPLKGQVVDKLPAQFNIGNRLAVQVVNGERVDVWQTKEAGQSVIYARSGDGTVIRTTLDELSQAGTQNPNSAEHSIAEQVTAAKQAAEQAENVIKFSEQPKAAPGLKIKIDGPTAQWTEQVLHSDNPLGVDSTVHARVQELDNQLRQAVKSGSQLKQAQVMTEMMQSYYAQIDPEASVSGEPGVKIVIDQNISQWNNQVLAPGNPLNVSPEVQAQVRELEAQFEQSATTDGNMVRQAEIMQKMQQLKEQTEQRAAMRDAA